jgi:hypothetical protein
VFGFGDFFVEIKRVRDLESEEEQIIVVVFE